APTRAERPFAFALAVVTLLGCAGLASAQSAAVGAPQPATLPPAVSSAQPIPVPRIPTMQVPSPILLARFQPPPRGRPGSVASTDDAQLSYQIQLEPPGLERLALSLTTDADLQERIRQETLSTRPTERVIFPEEPILSRNRYYGR